MYAVSRTPQPNGVRCLYLAALKTRAAAAGFCGGVQESNAMLCGPPVIALRDHRGGVCNRSPIAAASRRIFTNACSSHDCAAVMLESRTGMDWCRRLQRKRSRRRDACVPLPRAGCAEMLTVHLRNGQDASDAHVGMKARQDQSIQPGLANPPGCSRGSSPEDETGGLKW